MFRESSITLLHSVFIFWTSGGDALRTALVAGHLVAAVDVLALGAALRTRLRVRVEPPTRRVLLHRRLQRVHAVRLLEQRARLLVASLVLLDQRIQLTCSAHVLYMYSMDAVGLLHCMYCTVHCISTNTVFSGMQFRKTRLETDNENWKYRTKSVT